ncbi:MAG: hypothetical protein QG671_2715 [Actinomycetota bacterium]|nr:hypothetical protein [Actinomycetota bacterium]
MVGSLAEQPELLGEPYARHLGGKVRDHETRRAHRSIEIEAGNTEPINELVRRRTRTWEVPPAGDVTDPSRAWTGTVQVAAAFGLP